MLPSHFRSLLTALVWGSLISACHSDGSADADREPRVEGETVTLPGPGQGIAVAPVEQTAEQHLTLPGRLVWNEDRTVRVFSPFSGRVNRIVAQLGDHVKAGQTLAEITSPDFGAAQADNRKAKAAEVLAKKALAREKDLFEHGVGAAKDLQQAEADYAIAHAEDERTEALLRLFGDGGDAVSQRMALKSPIAGVIVERNLNPGQELRPDQTSAPLFVVTDPSDLWVQLDGHEGDLRDLKTGQQITLSTSQYRDETFTAVIDRVADFVDPTTRTLKVRGRVENPDRQLKGEMYISADITVATRERAVVPAQAVFLRGDDQYVFVAGNGSSYTRRHVVTRAEIGGVVPVIDGVQAGESVVTRGGIYLDKLLEAGHS